MRIFTKRKGKMIRNLLPIGNMVYFIRNGLPHTGIISAIESDSYEVRDVHGIFEKWDKDVMRVLKSDCISTQEIGIPKFPSLEIATAYKNMGELGLQYSNFPKNQVLKYGVVEGFNSLIEFIPGEMIFELADGKEYFYKSFENYGNLLVRASDVVIPIWMHHENNTDIESIVKGKLKHENPLPKVATEMQINKIYRIDFANHRNIPIHNIHRAHIQLAYNKENSVTNTELIDRLQLNTISKYNLQNQIIKSGENK